MSRASAMAALAGFVSIACDSRMPVESAVESEAFAFQPASVAKPNPSFLPFAFSVDNCVETVDVAGTFHENSQLVIGPGGREHVRFHINAKGTGVGRTTGARYQWNDRLFDIRNEVPASTLTFTLNDHTRLIGQGSAVNATIHTQAKVTVTAKGVVTVDRFRARGACG